MTAVVETEDLGRTYGDRIAVAGLDLTVAEGVSYGFLGPNGAGKTTTLAMLCTLLAPSAGRAVVAGYDVAAEPHRVRERIGLVFQEPTLDLDLTPLDTLRFHAAVFGTRWRTARPGAVHLLELLGLTAHQDRPMKQLSGGLRRRLEIARGLLHTPRVLFLDEPTTGLDPQTRAAVRDHLRELRDERGVTLFLTTHHLEEAEHCDQIGILDDGHLEVEGSPAELKAAIGADLVLLRTGDDQAAVALLRERFGLTAEAGPGGVSVRVADGAAFVPEFCAGAGVPVHTVQVFPPSLDDVFLHHTGRTLREEETGPVTLHNFGRNR